MASTPVFVDSGGWVALVSASDQHHAAADALFRQARAAKVPLLTTNLVIAEVHRLILHRAGPAPAAAVIDRVDSSPMVRLHHAGSAEHRAARAWLSKLHDQAITYTDAVSFSVMVAARCVAAITFDKDFWVAGFSRWQGNGRPVPPRG